MGLTLSMFCPLDEIVFTDCDTLMNFLCKVCVVCGVNKFIKRNQRYVLNLRTF